MGTIVVCGHSNCGGCAALHMTPAELEGLPAVSRWLQHSAKVPGRVARLSAEAGNSDAADREWLTEQINVLVQMRHLLTYPFIAERVRAGTLSVQGWYYVIDSGEVLVYDDARGNFEKVKA